MAVSLTEHLRVARGRVLEKTIRGADLALELSARYGYGLTVNRDDHSYVFHLPDAAADAEQARMIRQAALPHEDSLLRLRRRTHRGGVIVDACCGCGVRPVFYAKSMGAERVYAFGTSSRKVSLAGKNVSLNGMEAVVRTAWLNLAGEPPDGAVSSLDCFARDHKLDRIDVLSLNTDAAGAVADGGAEALIGAFGPAVVFWGHDAAGERVKALTGTLTAYGYKEPERWTPEILYWTPRL